MAITKPKPVNCVCGHAAVVVGTGGFEEKTVLCEFCNRVGPASKDAAAACEAWASDRRALKHFTPVMEALDGEMTACRDARNVTDCQVDCDQQCPTRIAYFEAAEVATPKQKPTEFAPSLPVSSKHPDNCRCAYCVATARLKSR